jgi:WD40 repeat protein
MFCKFSRTQPYVLFTFEESSQTIAFTIWKFDVQHNQVSLSLELFDIVKLVRTSSADLMNIQSPITCLEDSYTESLILCGCKDGSIFMIDADGAQAKTPQTPITTVSSIYHPCLIDLKKEICSIRWHPSNTSLIAICDESTIFLVDNNLCLLPIKLELDHIVTSLSIVDHLR